MSCVTLKVPIVRVKNLRVAMGRSGTLSDELNEHDIKSILGFPPRRIRKSDSDGKTTLEWDFTVAGKPLAIWNYKGFRWSCGGDQEIMGEIFGHYYSPDRW